MFAVVMGSYAHGACTTPVAEVGTLRFISPKMYFCNNSSAWVDATGSATPMSSCAGVTAGNFQYDSAQQTFKYCDGTNWYNMKGPSTGGACATSELGQLSFDATVGVIKFCAGTSFSYAGPAVSSSGDPCTVLTVGASCSGSTKSVYAGSYNPGGGTKKYMTTVGACPKATTNEPNCNLTDGTASATAPTAVATVANFASTTATTGAANTNLIVTANAASAVGTVSATRYCDALVLDGFTDWYLPAYDEVKEILQKEYATFNMNGGYTYVSSTMSANNSMRGIAASTGVETAAMLYSASNNYRCVRSY